MSKEIRTINRSLVFLKATTIALGIVLVVSCAGLILAKSHLKKSNDEQKTSNNCQDFLALKTVEEIQQIALQGNNIIALTKPNPKTKKQEIIKIDNNCLQVINRIEINLDK